MSYTYGGYTFQPGDIVLTQIRGVLGWVIRLGQAATGDPSRFTHVSVVVEGGLVAAAQPAGARYDTLADTVGRGGPVAVLHVGASRAERESFVRVAREFVDSGVKYSFLQYLSLAFLGFGFRPKWLRRYIAHSGRMICSQFVDEVCRRSGVFLFDDGRAPGDVTPGDLAHVGVVAHLGVGPFR